MGAGDQPEGEELERNEDRAGDEKGDERRVGRKASDAGLAPADSGQPADPRHAGLHRVPYPLLEKNPQRGQEHECAARDRGENVLRVSPHFHAAAPGGARLTPPLRPESRATGGPGSPAVRIAWLPPCPIGPAPPSYPPRAT